LLNERDIDYRLLNLHVLHDVVELAKRMGADQVVCSNLTFIIDKALWPEALFTREEEQQHLAVVLERIAEEARRENLLFAYSRPLLQKQPAHCSENICCSCVVSVTGEVSPCVFNSPTLSQADGQNGCKPLLHIFQNSPSICFPISLGNISEESLTQIWNKKEYIRFRKFHDQDTSKTGINSMPLPQSCASCYKRKA